MWIISWYYRKIRGYLYRLINRKHYSEETVFYGIPNVHRIDRLNCGRGLKVNPNVYINADGGVTIGNEVTLSYGVKIMASSYDLEQWKNHNRVHLNKGIKIGNHVWIGANSIILDNVSICDDVIIGAGSVVNKSILDSGSIYAGVPAKRIN